MLKQHLSESTVRTLVSKIQLAQGDQVNGTIFYKQIVRFGKWVNPMFPVESMELDKTFGQSIMDNFTSGLIGRVPVPLNHTDDVEENTGEVIKLEMKPDGLYAYLDIRRPEVAQDIQGGLIFDVSICFDWNYIDTATGAEHGPTLLHVALVNNPYLTGMSGFEQIKQAIEGLNRTIVEGALKLNPQFAKRIGLGVIMLSNDQVKEAEAMLVKITNEKEFEVSVTYTDAEGTEQTATIAAGAELEVPEAAAEAVKQQIADAVAPEANDEDENKDDAGADKGDENAEKPEDKPEGDAGDGADNEENKDENKADENGEDKPEDEKAELARLRAENRQMKFGQKYEELLKAGKITPAQKDKFMELANIEGGSVKLSSGATSSLLDVVSGILNAGPQVVKFDNEQGSGNNNETNTELSDDELDGFRAVGANPENYKKLVQEGRIKPDQK